MIPNNVHDPDFWLEELEPLLREIDFGLRIAVPQAHRFFTDFHKKSINRPLLSNLIRYHALEYLWSHGYAHAKEEDGDGWGMRGLPNNGIELLYKGSCVRVRKGIDPPYPTTVASLDFYQQKLFQEIEGGVITNLLVMFNLTAELQYDGKLKLMRPTKLNKRKKIVNCEWSRTVELTGIDLTNVVPPEYLHGSELPLGNQTESEKNSEQEKTGTDAT